MDREQKRFLEEIYDQYYSKVYNYIFYRVLNVGLTDELVRDIFIKLVESHHMPSPNISFSSWIFTIARNLLFERLQKNILAQGDMPKEATVFQNEEPRKIYAILKHLNERERSVLALRFWWKLPYTEIGKHLGLSKNNVSTILAHTIKKCRRFSGTQCLN
ncbi:sigma-70 family RNA polymerase sigma factor [Christensenellaceae bacterium OttesenSCG-928-K19]|nr:sigma-70 family RNA polymerase sigma factor [Christensenellaceae bacterium OttesenSCG-928-K19]